MSNKQTTNTPKSKKRSPMLIILGVVVVLAVVLAVFLMTRQELDYLKTESYIGLSETEATQKAQDVGYEVRIVERDGQPLGQDTDLKDDRINFSISNGEIEEAEIY